MVYDRRHFEDAAVTRMLGHLKTLLEGMADRPDQPLATLPLLTEQERRQLVVRWNDTAAPRPYCVTRNASTYEYTPIT